MLLNCNIRLTSHVYEHITAQGAPYLTRFGEAGARGIDHIFGVKDKNCEKKIEASSLLSQALPQGIDHTIRDEINTDHSLIYKDIRLGWLKKIMQHAPFQVTRYDSVSRIKIKPSKMVNPNTGEPFSFDFDSTQYPSDQVAEDRDLLKCTKAKTARDSIITITHLQPIINMIKNMKEKNIIDTRKENADGYKGVNVSRKKVYAEVIDQIGEKFFIALHEVVKQSVLSGAGFDTHRYLAEKERHKAANLECPRSDPSPKTKLSVFMTVAIEKSSSKIARVNRILKCIAPGILHYRSRKLSTPSSKNPPDYDNTRSHTTIDSLSPETIAHIQKSIVHVLNSEPIILAMENILYQIKTQLGEKELNMNAVRHHRNMDKEYLNVANSNSFNLSPQDSQDLNNWLDDNKIDYKNCSDKLIRITNKCKELIQNDWNIKPTFHSKVPKHNKIQELRRFYKHNDFCTNLFSSLQHLNSLQTKIFNLQQIFKKRSLLFHSALDQTGAMARMIRHKVRNPPVPYPKILEGKNHGMQGNWRNARNIYEALTGTQQLHSIWMNKSQAKEECFFAHLVNDDIGPSDVLLLPDRKFMRENVQDVVFESERLSEEVIQAVIDAHGPHIAQLFKPPDLPNPTLHYPYFFLYQHGRILRYGTLQAILEIHLNSPIKN